MKKIAIIGAGQVAEIVHAAYYLTKPETFQLVAVVDPNLSRAELFCQRNQFKQAYTSTTEKLIEEQPDIVSVCTPNRFHYDSVMSALAAGCSVFCEKPPAMTSLEAENMWKLAEKKICLFSL